MLDQIGVARADVKTLGAPPPALRARARFLSEALRPAESTHFWRRKRDDLGDAAIGEGLSGVALIVADNENEEALALAVAMRGALETPGKTAALITPDPAIARRVAAELARWGIEVENTAGRALGDTAGGVFARLALAAACDFSPLPLAALLGHPLMRLGRAPDVLAAEARALELSVLRMILPPFGLDDIGAAFAAARAAAKNRHAHRAIRSLGEEELRCAEALLRDLAAALAPLRGLASDAPLGKRLAAHRAALATLLAPDEAGPGLGALDALFDEAVEAAPESFLLSLPDYAALFDSLLAGQRAPLEPGGHPRLAILGLLEARLLSFDLTLLAGLDETVWPPAAETDAFLNRPMRAELGLSAPERRIGQTAHDFTAALGAREAVLSRAKKRGGSPTVASRFLQRIGAVAGEATMRRIEARGEHWLAPRARARSARRLAADPPTGAAAETRSAAEAAQRHPHRGSSPRSLFGLCRKHTGIAAAGADRRRGRAERDRRRLARRAAKILGKPRRRTLARRDARAVDGDRASLVRALARRPRVPCAAVAAHRRGSGRVHRLRRGAP